MVSMTAYNNDSTASRIAWAMRQKRISGRDLAAATGLHHVYISQLKNDTEGKYHPTVDALKRIATALGVTVGFLVMETDEPAPVNAESVPIYFSPEADAAAQLIDDAPPEDRARILAVVRLLVKPVSQADKSSENEGVIYLPKFTQQLIFGDETSKRSGEPSW